LRLLGPALIAAMTMAAGTPAVAESTREYFVAHVEHNAAPQQLDQKDRDYYRALFDAIDGHDWAKVQAMLAQRDDGLLQPVARAEYYLAPNSPKVSLEQIQQWLDKGRDLPEAPQLGRLALARGAATMPDLPDEQTFYPRSTTPKRARPRTVDDGTMPAPVRQQILDRITNDDPDGARQLLDGIDASLSPEARVADGSGAWVAEGDWTAGLAAWRMGDCAAAEQSFRRSAGEADNPELRSAAYYWASRSALRCRHPERSAELLRGAAFASDSLYGMLAAQQLGERLPDLDAKADFTDADWRKLKHSDNVRVAIALTEIGRDDLASEVLVHEAKIADPKEFGPLSRLARDLGLAQTQLYMAYNAPDGANPDPASRYPTPKWTPLNGWQVDPALAFAHALQESNFRSNAVSPADARGLMQITPITVREHAPRLGLSATQVDIFDPSTNLAFGQVNLEMLRDSSATQGELPKVMAAYNAGLQPVTRWNTQVNDQGDPLLYMESIPYWETRSYVATVMRNYWMYERQAKAQSASRVALAENAWPMFPDAGNGDSGRVYLTAENN
jgi:soluble lytic murein transglycosylase